MSNFLGAMIGAAIDRDDGDSGLKGAIVGIVAENALKAVIPIVATYALGWTIQYGIGKLWQRTAIRADGRRRDYRQQAGVSGA